MPPSRPHIIVEDLRIGWGTRVLMEHVTFDIERGTTMAILGASFIGCVGLQDEEAGGVLKKLGSRAFAQARRIT